MGSVSSGAIDSGEDNTTNGVITTPVSYDDAKAALEQHANDGPESTTIVHLHLPMVASFDSNIDDHSSMWAAGAILVAGVLLVRQADAAACAAVQRSLAIRAVRVSGHVGGQSGTMGVYALDATHSPMRGVNVYSLVGASGVHLYHVTGGRWCISDTEDMVWGATACWIASTTASPSPLGLQWKASDGTALHLDPQLTVTEMSAAELAAARAAAEADTQRSLAIHAVRVSGHVGGQSGKMGLYALDATHSPKRGKNVYSHEGVTAVHLYNATNGTWWISDTEDMVEGKNTGWIASTTASPSPLGLQWKYATHSGLHLDPLITVTEISAAELAAARAAAEAETQRSLAIRAVRVSGHVGKQCGRMGVYALDTTHSPKRGKNVYSLEGASGIHMYHSTDGIWFISVDTENMVAGKNSGCIASTTASPSPLGLQWKAYDGTAWHLDPLLAVTEHLI